MFAVYVGKAWLLCGHRKVSGSLISANVFVSVSGRPVSPCTGVFYGYVSRSAVRRPVVALT